MTSNMGNAQTPEITTFVSQQNAKTSLVRCTGCGEEASTARRFCGKCGDQLWDPCLGCAEKNPVDIRFCGRCGADLPAEIAKVRKNIEAALVQAEQQATSGRFLDAAATLTDVEKVDHSQLAELVQAVEQRLEKFHQDREQAILNSSSVIKDCKSLLAAQRYHEAHERIASIPVAFQSQQVRDLAAEVQTYVDESSRLRALVKTAMQSKDYDNALPQVMRLAELNPEDEQLAKVLVQLQQRQSKIYRQQAVKLCAEAKSALAKNDYEQAVTTIEQIDSAVDDAAVLQLVGGVKERSWLAEQLRIAPHATPTLLAIAARLNKLQPEDGRHVALAKQLQSRWTQATQTHPGKPVPWAKPPEVSRLEVPISLLPTPKLLQETSQKSVVPQSMLVPFGLALQSIGQVDIAVELNASEKKKSWRKLIKLKGPKHARGTGWGIEVGSKNLKAVQLALPGDGQALELLQTIVIPHASQGPADFSAHEENREASKTILKFLEQHDLRGHAVTVNLPGAKTLARFFDLPATKSNKFKDAVEYEVRARIPLEAEDTLYDYHWFDLPQSSASQVAQRRVMLVAANKKHAEILLSPFEEAGLASLTLQSDCVALHNAIHAGLPELKANEAKQHTAVVEIGAAASNFLVFSSSGVWFRGLYAGMSQLDKVLSRELKKTLSDAEVLRRRPEQAARMHEIHECLLPEFQNLTEALQRTIQRYQHETGNAVSRLYLCGGGAQQYGLLRFLQSPD